MKQNEIIRMATLAGARPGFDNQADMAFLQDFAALVADAATAPLGTRIAELEAQLYANDARGVGQSIKPQAQVDTAQKPAAWICEEWSGSGAPELSFDGPPQKLSVRDELTRPVWTPLYTAPQPARQPLTEDEIKAAAGLLIDNLNPWMVAFARAVEEAHSIIGDQ